VQHFDWDRLSGEIGEEECRRLRPWLILHHHLRSATQYGLLFCVLSAAYNGIHAVTELWTAPLGGPSQGAQNDDWPLLGPLAFVVVVLSLLLNGVAGRLLGRRLAHLRARRTIAAEASGAEAYAGAAAAPPPAAEDAAGGGSAAQLTEQIAALHERWEWMRDRLGEREWRRLVKLRSAWVLLWQIRNWSLIVTAFYVALVALEILVKGKGLPLALAWHPFQLAPFLAILSAGALWATTTIVRARFEKLAWEGCDPGLLEQALWTEHAARYLEAEREERSAQEQARRRLAEERRTGPPCWRVEFSGGHLVWWLSLLIVVGAAAKLSVPALVWAPALATVIVGGLVKLVFWVLYASTTDAARVGRLHFYRWWTRGWLPVVLALLPAALVLWAMLSGG